VSYVIEGTINKIEIKEQNQPSEFGERIAISSQTLEDMQRFKRGTMCLRARIFNLAFWITAKDKRNTLIFLLLKQMDQG
jgi:hypothetical protein